MSDFLPILKSYLRNPGNFIAHGKRAFSVLSDDGISGVRALVNNRIKINNYEQNVIKLFQSIATNNRRNVSDILATLKPYAADLDVLDIVHDPHEQLRLIQCHLLKKFKLFDDEVYAQRYLAKVPGILPIDHYFKYGYAAGNAPNAYFDPATYLIHYPDVATFGMDPMLHYALFGWNEGRTEGVRFDAAYYLEANPSVKDANMEPFIHYMRFGRKENRPIQRNDDVHFPIMETISDPSELAKQGLVKDAGTIVLVSHDAELGGAQQVILVFAEWLLASTKYNVRFVTMRGGAFAHKFAAIAPTFDVSACAESEVSTRLENFIGGDVKAMFVNSIASGGILNHWRDDTTPVIAFIHELPKILQIYETNVTLLRKRATTIIAGSEAVRTALRDQFNITAERLEVVYGYIEKLDDSQKINFEDKRAAKKAVGLNPDLPVITACGVLHWRKSPDKFIAVAEKVLNHYGKDAQFVWIGGGPDHEKCEALIKEKGLQDRIQITGYEPDIMRYLHASDIFLLPSQEDPFPLVCLYAASALNPVICFKKAGGMPEFVDKGCGYSVRFGNVTEMAKTVIKYLDNKSLRQKHGLKGADLVKEQYTISTAGPQLLHYIRQAAGLKPFVSVVVPNYNYEKFLPERLQSIVDQTFQDFELILLDDKSKDKSVEIMEEWVKKRPGTRLVVNTKNSGSPFAQWIKGMRMAQSDLIWLAEADDVARPELLSTLLPYFQSRNVFLGYCKSVPINADGEIMGDYEDMYLNRIAEGRWSNSYVTTDHIEASLGLGIANCIPNASSVVFRRFDPEPEFEACVTNMRMCGDWKFYLRAMKGGLIAYVCEELNLHRRHANTVTKSTEGSLQYFDEFALIRDYVGQTYNLSQEALNKIEVFTNGDLDRFGITDQNKREDILSKTLTTQTEKAMPSGLFVISDLAPGGGQMLGIRMANAWMKRGGRAILLNARHFPDHEKVLSLIDPRLTLIHMGDDTPHIPELITQFGLDFIQTSIWWSERLVHEQLGDTLDLPWVTSMHGCHETILENPEADPSFPKRIKDMMGRVNHWVHTADKNLQLFDTFGTPAHTSRIPNGVDAASLNVLTREELGLRKAAVVLCVASRAITEKGWFEAVKITEILNAQGKQVDLMLIGEGPAADKIRAQAPPHVHLYGQVDNLQDYIAASDIGLLPSFFLGESMPLVLLEMMAQGKPIIATDVGEIPDLIGQGDTAAGFVVPLTKAKKVNTVAFTKAIKNLTVKRTRAQYGDAAKRRFETYYTLDIMMDRYENLYRSLLEDAAKNISTE